MLDREGWRRKDWLKSFSVTGFGVHKVLAQSSIAVGRKQLGTEKGNGNRG